MSAEATTIDTTQEFDLFEVDLDKDLICESIPNCYNKAEWAQISCTGEWSDGTRGPLLVCSPCREIWITKYYALQGHLVRFVRL